MQINKSIQILVQVVTTRNWIQVQITDKCSFMVPPALVEVKARSIDSHSRGWKGNGITVNFDYGLFSDPLTLYSNKLSFHISEEKIDGLQARIVWFQKDDGWNIIGIHFLDLGKNNYNQTIKLTVVVEIGPNVDKEIGFRIIKSVKCTNNFKN